MRLNFDTLEYLNLSHQEMMSYFRLVLFILLSTSYSGGAKAQTQVVSDSDFVKFSNNNKVEAKADAEITIDKSFTIKLPIKVHAHETIVGGNFTHIFKYKNHEEIILIYVPNFNRDTSKGDSQYLSISHTEFEKLIGQHDLDQEIREYSKILRGRFFGVKAIRKENFYVFYVNVKSKDVSAFNYAIKSIELN